MNESQQIIDLIAGQTQALRDLARELAEIHGAMFSLIKRLYKTQLSPTQAALLASADAELAASQKRFFATYGDELGGAAPEKN
jgi:hypothetical protein